MRVIAFPGRRMSPVDEAALAQIEAALDGDGTGPEAEYWRELRADVRSLADPIDPAFARALEERVRAADRPPRRRRLQRLPRPRAVHIGSRGCTALAIAAASCAVLVAVIVAGTLSGNGSPSQKSPAAAGPEVSSTHEAINRFGPRIRRSDLKAAPAGKSNGPPLEASSRAGASGAVAGAAQPSPAAGSESAAEAGGRLQHLGASISLNATGAEGVQQIAGRVGRATVAAGGFVESSRVQTQQGSPGEALMTLSLPSAKLASVLAELERIAPVRAETQSLEDITSEYDAAAGRLSAARGERSALLRALAKAETPAAIESLHARIAQADSDISAAERRRASISRRASQSQVEVTVLGQAHHAAGGLTLGRGVSDAGHVLTAVLAVLIVAAAVLVPVALIFCALLLGGRFWRRQRRERVLGAG